MTAPKPAPKTGALYYQAERNEARADCATMAELLVQSDGGAWLTCRCCSKYAHQTIAHAPGCLVMKYASKGAP